MTQPPPSSPMREHAPPTFNIQYISDIHLEMYATAPPFTQFLNPTSIYSDYLALLGDIGTPESSLLSEFLAWCSEHWKHVFWIPGNHEFYNYSEDSKKNIDVKMNELYTLAAPYPNIHLLQRGIYDIQDIRIIGCTLWSYIPPHDEERALMYMNDTRRIFVHNAPARPANFNAMHTRDLNWLLEQLKIAQEARKQVIVMTHHLPSFQLIAPKYRHYKLNSCFATNLEHLFAPPVCVWLCGHTHTANDMSIRGIRCYLNPYGYPYEHTGGRITKYITCRPTYCDTIYEEEEEPAENPCGIGKSF